ncbi:hypothetical protein F4781DRAFT_396884 [Annulohypoxylon bovei var. microspora]|nr:hypothetical protein F4781DRAFT_396884 [Annulohypoxylon bovei var. microspora]
MDTSLMLERTSPNSEAVRTPNPMVPISTRHLQVLLAHAKRDLTSAAAIIEEGEKFLESIPSPSRSLLSTVASPSTSAPAFTGNQANISAPTEAGLFLTTTPSSSIFALAANLPHAMAAANNSQNPEVPQEDGQTTSSMAVTNDSQNPVVPQGDGQTTSSGAETPSAQPAGDRGRGRGRRRGYARGTLLSRKEWERQTRRERGEESNSEDEDPFASVCNIKRSFLPSLPCIGSENFGSYCCRDMLKT